MDLHIDLLATLALAVEISKNSQPDHSKIKNLIEYQTPPAPDFNKEVLEPLKKEQAERERIAAEARRAAEEAAKKQQADHADVPAPASQAPSNGLRGSIGIARGGGNCVNEPGIHNPFTGNPISWLATSRSGSIGATALFSWNHVGVVTGIWSNGDLEIRHQNCGGCPTRYPASTFRGFR